MIKNLTSEIVLQNKYNSFYALVNGPESKKKKKKKKQNRNKETEAIIIMHQS